MTTLGPSNGTVFSNLLKILAGAVARRGRNFARLCSSGRQGLTLSAGRGTARQEPPVRTALGLGTARRDVRRLLRQATRTNQTSGAHPPASRLLTPAPAAFSPVPVTSAGPTGAGTGTDRGWQRGPEGSLQVRRSSLQRPPAQRPPGPGQSSGRWPVPTTPPGSGLPRLPRVSTADPAP